jgi:hypothetical protein
MIKQEAFSCGIDLKEFFEASVRALQNERKSIANRAIVDRNGTNETLKKKAVADAARALTALWKAQTSTRTI